MADTNDQRRAKLKAAIEKSAAARNLSLSPQAVDAIIDRALGHVVRRTSRESVRQNDIDNALMDSDRLINNLKAFKSEDTFTSVDFRNYVQSSVNCFYPFCKPTK